MTPLPPRNELTLCFALRNTGLNWFEVRSLDELQARIAGVDVLLSPVCGETS